MPFKRIILLKVDNITGIEVDKKFLTIVLPILSYIAILKNSPLLKVNVQLTEDDQQTLKTS